MSLNGMENYTAKITIRSQVFDKEGKLVFENEQIMEHEGENLLDYFSNMLKPNAIKKSE